MPETVVLCGDAPRPKRPRKVLHLAVSGPGTNVRLESEDVGRRMLKALPATLSDLLDVATYVYAADQMVRRGGETGSRLGSDWRRDFRFVVPVREPERWASPEVTSILGQLLAFMSEDRFRFEFVQDMSRPEATDYFDFGGEDEEVVLFSGGLDSLAGTVDRLVNSTARLLLVSHVSSTKIGSRQKELAGELAKRFSGRVVHIPVRIRTHGSKPVERTQRTRSFLFGALAGIVARTSGAGAFSLFENGVVSFNLPIASQVVGAAATRTTHPRVVRDLSAFLSTLVDGEMRVENPFIWMTKTEVAANLGSTDHADLARRTISCSSIHTSTRMHSHCGRCSQCLDRRFGALAGGLGEHDPAEMYEVDLLTGAREDGRDRVMAESFVRHALELQDISHRSFMNCFAGEVARTATCFPGLSAAKAVDATLDLHRRHAAAVHSVLERGYKRHSSELASQTLPPTCILRLVAGPIGVVTAKAGEPQELPAEAEYDVRDYRRSSQLRLALDHQGKRVLIEGAQPLDGASSFAVIRELVETAQKDQSEGVAPENHTFIAARRLSQAITISDESLRRCIYRIRSRLDISFTASAGLPLSADALIENAPWKGYRLNPAVLILAPEEIASERGGHDAVSCASRLDTAAYEKSMA